MQQPKEPPVPWYRQFWPWFLIGLPAAVVIAGFTTLFIALNNPHSMVNDSYYEEGLAINRSLEQDTAASALGLSARIFFDAESGQVRVNLLGQDRPERLNLSLMHPVSASFDQQVQLVYDQDGDYLGEYQPPAQSSYYLRLTPPEANWRLNGQVDFQLGSQVLLESR